MSFSNAFQIKKNVFKYFLPIMINSDISEIIKSNSWARMPETKIHNIRNDINQDFIEYIIASEKDKNSYNNQFIPTDEIYVQNLILANLKELILISKNKCIPFEISDIVLNVFLNGILILTFDVKLIEMDLTIIDGMDENTRKLLKSSGNYNRSEMTFDAINLCDNCTEKVYINKLFKNRDLNIQTDLITDNSCFKIGLNDNEDINYLGYAVKIMEEYSDYILAFNSSFRIHQDDNTKIAFYSKEMNQFSFNDIYHIINEILKTFSSKLEVSQGNLLFDKGIISYKYTRLSSAFSNESFYKDLEEYIFRLLKMTNSKDNVYFNKKEFVQKTYSQYNNVIHYFSAKGGGCIVFDYDGVNYFRFRSGTRILKYYFLPLLASLHQQFSLLDLSKELASVFIQRQNMIKKNSKKNLTTLLVKDVENIMYKFRSFVACCWFSNYSNLESRNTIYKKWKEILGVNDLYEDLREQIHDTNEFILLKKHELDEINKNRQNSIIALVSLVFLPLNLFVGFMGMNIKEFTNAGKTNVEALVIFLVIFLVSLLILTGIIFIINRVYKKDL